VVLENVAAILTRGLGEVLIGLESVGYDCEWHCIPASHLGAPHRRDRWWCVAHPVNGTDRAYPRAQRESHKVQGVDRPEGCGGMPGRTSSDPEDVADTNQPGLQGRECAVMPERAGEWSAGSSGNQGDIGRQPFEYMGLLAHGLSTGLARYRWLPEPGVGRVAASIPYRSARLKALGNSLIPAMPEIIGTAILNREKYL